MWRRKTPATSIVNDGRNDDDDESLLSAPSPHRTANAVAGSPAKAHCFKAHRGEKGSATACLSLPRCAHAVACDV